MAREEELKFSVPGVFTLPDLTDPEVGVAQVVEGGRLALKATYYDTPDLRLARNNVTLRHRTGEGGPRWTLKLPVSGSGPSVRDEIEVAGPAGAIPESLCDLTIGWVRDSELLPITTLRTDRKVRLLLGAEGEELAEVVDDTVSVMEGRRLASRFREIEVERRAISDETLSAVARRLAESGAIAGEFTPKVIRALGPRARAAGDLPPPIEVGPEHPAADAIGSAVREGAARLIGNDLGVRRREYDAVHQMRVACRRMRSDLRTFSPLVEQEWATSLRAELSWLAGVLGGPRDLEVMRERLTATAVRDPLAPMDMDAVARMDAELAERERRLLAELDEALRSVRYRRLLDQVLAAARSPEVTPTARGEPSSEALPPLVAVTWDALERKGRKLTPVAPDDKWHRVRILAKRARYASEAVAPSLGDGAVRFAKAAQRVQTVLGEHQDAAVAAQTWLDIASHHRDDPELVVTAGRLAERERAAVRAARSAFPEAWRDIKRRGALRWMGRG